MQIEFKSLVLLLYEGTLIRTILFFLFSVFYTPAVSILYLKISLPLNLFNAIAAAAAAPKKTFDFCTVCRFFSSIHGSFSVSYYFFNWIYFTPGGNLYFNAFSCFNSLNTLHSQHFCTFSLIYYTTVTVLNKNNLLKKIFSWRLLISHDFLNY